MTVSLGKYNIKTRLVIGFGTIVVFGAILVIVGIWGLYSINGKLKQVINENNVKTILAQNIQNQVNTIDKSVMTVALVNDSNSTESERKMIEDARAAFKDSLDKLEKMEKTPKGKGLINDIKESFEIAQMANNQVIEFMKKGDTQQGRDMATGSMGVSSRLYESCNAMMKFQEELIKTNGTQAQRAYTIALIIFLVCGIIVLIVCFGLGYLLTKSITKPLNEGVVVAQRISEGDLTAQIESVGTDETGQLMGAMKNMVAKLRSIIGEVKSAAENIASSSHQLNASSELMSKGAGEQANRASQVATASEEMSQTVLDIAKNTSSIEASATDTTKLAKNGEVVVNKSVDKVKYIAKTIDQSAQLIKSLGERSNQIGEIVNVINDIADQTNLLALNAAIEAARAGEQGRGFAVVADEVRKLAERTGNSTAEIGTMVKSIQNEVHQIVLSMENITKEVKAGVDLSTEAGGVLRNIVESADKLHLMVQQIASATEEMASTSEEINKDIEMISSLSTGTSGSSEEITKASHELSKLSVNLEDVVKGFKV